MQAAARGATIGAADLWAGRQTGSSPLTCASQRRNSASPDAVQVGSCHETEISSRPAFSIDYVHEVLLFPLDVVALFAGRLRPHPRFGLGLGAEFPFRPSPRPGPLSRI